ncbi:MAG: hypothetical protein GX032_00570 [Tenericutes bacterium]|jgi:hypothetical protein|nr:hypothetical protein [Bacilli bacterium]NLV89961.1 hypothetical protein [Mycoplasmatota bacterium]
MEFILIGVIVLFIFQSHRLIDSKKFIDDNQEYFRGMMEDDYEFFLKSKYGDDVDVNAEYSKRIRNGIVTIVVFIFLFLNNMNFINILASFVLGYLIFKQGYSSVKSFYKRHLHMIDLQLPYFLKSLEILSQHYTIPVAISRSIDSAPEVFKPGLKELIAKINAGNSTVEPYMDFAKMYPVSDSVRMMRLLYRLSLGSQDDKHEQLIMFSKSVSSLQNKARSTRYKERLDKMENKSMIMLTVVGLGVMAVLLFAMMTNFAI